MTDEKRIIDVLNRKQPSAADYEAARERFDERLAPIGQEEFRPFFREYLSLCLRAYVDPWLDSGRNPNGLEEPFRRTLSYSAKSTIWGYLNTHRPDYLPSSDPWGFSFILDPFTDHQVVKETVFQAVENNAIRLFCALAVSEWRVKVCKCRYVRCSKYFLQEEPRATYKNGTFCCPAHRGSACAEALRFQAHATLIESAANWLLKKQPSIAWKWNEDVALKRRLAHFLSVQLGRSGLKGGPDEIKMKWVTQNSSEIERRRRTLFARTLLLQ